MADDVVIGAAQAVAMTVWDLEKRAIVSAATLMGAQVAIAPSGVLPPDGRYMAALFGGPADISVSVGQMLTTIGVMTLELSVPAKPLPIAPLVTGACESAWADDEDSPSVKHGHVVTAGLRFGAVFDTPAPLGAPIVMNGNLVGMIAPDPVTRSGTHVLAATIVRDAIFRRSEFTDEKLFALLDGSARRALSHAVGMTGGSRVHAENLVMGLYENPDGSTRRLLAGKRISEVTLTEVLRNAVKSTWRRDYEPQRLTAMPSLSGHVREAFVNAALLARSQGEARIRGRHLLYGLVSVQDCAVTKALAAIGIRPDTVQLRDTTRIFGYASDVASGLDRLGIDREARAFAAVLGATSVAPPIAVGLLGNWGSGKSFFMNELRSKLIEVESRGRAGDAECCSNIIQIWFNAWHYIDSNLWASLTSAIFDSLDEEMTIRSGSKTDRDVERAQLFAKSAQLQSQREIAQKELRIAQAELDQIGQVRHSLANDNEVAARLTMRDVGNAAVEFSGIGTQVKNLEREAKRTAEGVAADIGLDAQTVQSLRGTAGRIRAMGHAISNLQGRRTWYVLIAIAALAAAMALAAPRVFPSVAFWLKSIGGLGIAGAFARLVALVVKYKPRVDDAIRRIDKLLRTKDKLIKDAREKELAALESRTRAANTRIAEAKARELDLEKELRENEEEILRRQPIQQMKSFVRERSESTDYTRHLGVIAHAHQDFARLSQYFANTRVSDEMGGTRPLVDRIVLYIDDLDRCPEQNVTEVLQAVHLLLAFPLFVVVVGVDSSWLLHSLQTRMAQFQVTNGPGDLSNALDRAIWESTPINYLEKIFQVPFALKAMATSGFEELIDDLTAKRPSAEGDVPNSAADSEPETATGTVARVDATRTSANRTPSGSSSGRPASTPHLTLNDDEIGYMKALYPLMPSPRGAKRFVNLYRIYRGLIDDYQLENYLDPNTAEYEAGLLLLAMLIGFPEETTDILEILVTAPPTEPWWKFVETFLSPDKGVDDRAKARRAAFVAKLSEIKRKAKRPDDSRSCDDFARCAPEIARFSFHSGRVSSLQTVNALTAQSTVPPGMRSSIGARLHPTP